MVKGSLFWANGVGKLGQMVISRRGGEEITRAYQPNVKNPKSSGQMIQRAKFANAVKFYKHAVENFFPFSFEDKKKNESYFNAFMRNNVNVASVTSKAQTEGNYPALGNEWMLTKGSLDGVQYGMETKTKIGQGDYGQATLYMPASIDLSQLQTVSDYSKALLAAYPSLKEGDILTFLIVRSAAKTALENPSDLESATWELNQFVLNTSDKSSYVLFLTTHAHEITWGEGVYGIGGCAVIVSRKVNENNVMVSTSTLVNNFYAINAIKQLSAYPLFGENLKSWGAKDSDAILKGDISINVNATVTGVSTDIDGTKEEKPGATFNVTKGNEPSELFVYGTNLQNVKEEDLYVEGNGKITAFSRSTTRIYLWIDQAMPTETWNMSIYLKGGMLLAKFTGNTAE